VSVNRSAAGKPHELVLSPAFDFLDSLLSQSSRCCVRKLSKHGGMQSLCFRYRLSFDRALEPLHRFFDFR